MYQSRDHARVRHKSVMPLLEINCIQIKFGFKVILGYLRTGRLDNLYSCTLKQLEVEADFFGLTGLIEVIQSCI